MGPRVACVACMASGEALAARHEATKALAASSLSDVSMLMVKLKVIIAHMQLNERAPT